MNLNEKLSVIQTELHAKKSKWNGFGKYNYRSAEDILEALKPHLKKHKVTVRIDETLQEIGGMLIMYSTAVISDNEDEIQAVAIVGVDMDQRGMNVPQKFGSASSYAKKYALGNLFLIDDTADPDATNNHNTKAVAEKKLLNKDTPEFKKAQVYLKGGGKISNIEAKYRISKEVKELLTK